MGKSWQTRVEQAEKRARAAEQRAANLEAEVERLRQQLAEAVSVADPDKLMLVPAYGGIPIDDMRSCYWAIVDQTVYWSEKPWVLPDQELLFKDPDHCHGAIEEGGGVAYDGGVIELRGEGGDVLVLHNPQVGGQPDRVWLRFSAAREVMATAD